MGSGSSKHSNTPPTQTWTSDSPVRFSEPLVDSLQSSTESDSTRARTLELHIQSRVNAELQRLQEQASKDFEALSTKLSSETDSSSPGSDKDSKNKEDKAAGDQLRQVGREAVQNDVNELRKKLDQRKKVQELDEGVQKAKSEVVKCLRENDRRPLDCWKEVEAFRTEVRRMEGVWVEKIVR